jgi:hypothetical protein
MPHGFLGQQGSMEWARSAFKLVADELRAMMN